MYTIKAIVDGKEYLLHDPLKNLFTKDAYYIVGDNINGQAEFTVYPDNPNYKHVRKLVTDIEILKDGIPEFHGRVLYDNESFSGAKKVFVEGELAFFCDSIQRPKKYQNISLSGYLQDIIANHNAQVEQRKQFVLGRVTVQDSNDNIYRYSNYENTRTVLKEKLVDRLGGHLVVRHENGQRILDYLDDATFYKRNNQKIEFGKNLLDFSKNMDASDVATCIIPLGKKLDPEEQDESLGVIKEQRINIRDVNGGVDYVTDDNAVREYGKIYKTVIFDDISVPATLVSKGKEWLKSVQFEKLVLEVKAIDLNLTDEVYQAFEIGDMVQCVSKPNGLDKEIPLTQKKTYLTNFAKNTITLGDETRNKTYTSSNRQESAQMEQEIQQIPSKSEILEEALKNAQDLINGASKAGYAIHEPNEFIVADDKDYKNKARNLWRWGMGGLAHYSQGYSGPIDGIALTMDGKINGKMILANSIVAQSIDIGYRTEVQNAITDAENSANEYTDNKQKLMKEQIETQISNAENKIVLSASSLKEYVSRKNYVANGEQETLSIGSFNVSGTYYASVSVAEYLHMKCIKIAWNTSGTVSLIQNLGSLESGDYTNVCDVAYESGKRPSYVQIGFSGNQSTVYLDSFSAGEFRVVKKSVNITQASKSIAISAYGTAGTVLYITNIRCLRDITEVIDSTKATLVTEINKVTAAVNTKFEDYATRTETTSLIQAAESRINLNVSQNYATKNQLNGLVTESQMNSAIQLSEKKIDMSVSQKYATKDQVSGLVTESEMNAAIRVASDSINLAVSKKVGKDEIISVINQSAESVKIKANHIELTGNVTISALSQDALSTIKGYSNQALADAKNYTEQQLNSVKSDAGNLLKGSNLTQADITKYWDTSGDFYYNQSDPLGGKNAVKLDAPLFTSGSGSGDYFLSAKYNGNNPITAPAVYEARVWLKSDFSTTIKISLNRTTFDCNVTTQWKQYRFMLDVKTPDTHGWQNFTIGGWSSITDGDTIYIYKPEVIISYSPTDILNLLTNNGAMDGLFIRNNKIYMKGSYIDINDLKALNATIGGFSIGSSGIYKGCTSITSTGQGVYVGTNGIRLYVDNDINLTFDMAKRKMTLSGVQIEFKKNANAERAVMDGRDGTVTCRYGLHVYTKREDELFTDGTRMDESEFVVKGLPHITSGTMLVRESESARICTASSSSKRYKNHVANMTVNEAEKILDIPVVWFKYKEGYLAKEDRFVGKAIPGFYAEDVEKYFPVAAQKNEDGSVEDWNYRMLIPAMMKLIQELYKRTGGITK